MKKLFKKFVDWYTAPVTDIIQNVTEQIKEPVCEEENNNMKPILPVNPTPAVLYRPISFTEYIGQEKSKEKIKSYINGTQSRGKIFPHTLISGKAGCGKTTLARIMANELNVPFKEIITANMSDIEEFKWLLMEVKNGIIFMDEIHSLSRNLAERLYSIMEDFKDDGKPIEPFTLIGATTELGEILKNRKPFVSRFEIKIELDDYTIDELALIVKQYRERAFKNDNISESIYNIVALNCRNTPRTAISLLKDCIYTGNIDITLKNNNIIKEGYTYKDLKILKYLAENKDGVGLNGVANFLDTSVKNYQYEVENFLIKNSLITKTTRGRKITQRGLDKIIELEK
jgi:Holliday junction DNA helicase RuvB